MRKNTVTINSTMRVIVSIALLCAFVGARLVDCDDDVCTFTDVVEAPVTPNVVVAFFNANTTYIGAEAFYNTNLSSIYFHTCGVTVEPDAFDTLESVSIGCNNETFTITCESGVGAVSTYVYLCSTCIYLN